ncbi:hypothetical protein [Rickettsiella endosymbiont of Dermanyssus gallinae]|uniref:hypothetical protein n=1 Tax=Rickettsiella endosymbiont of Dermanyssus gallinae TaxID=2856608 RepID=UPI001C529599|nr:hypothetical protein [Rickettsiella endosymbiont of Dermanyssus gallinae]
MQFNIPIRHHQSKLPFNFWNDTQALYPYEKLCLAYLYTSPFSNRLGCFYCPLDNIIHDLAYAQDEDISDLESLEEKAFVSGDALREWIYLPHYLIYFPIRNPNQGKHIERLFYDIPWECSFYPDLVLRLLCVDHLSNSFRKYLEQELSRLIKKQIIKRRK